MKTNLKIDDFIQDIEDNKRDVVVSLRELILSIAPEAKEEIKWGGLVFFNERPFCGIMVYKKYVSVVIDRGAEIPDPYNFLEGGGKNRGHLKIFQHVDIKNKTVEYYVRRSFKL